MGQRGLWMQVTPGGMVRGSGWRGWLFTATTLIGPVGFLFHRPFLTEVVAPFLGALAVSQ